MRTMDEPRPKFQNIDVPNSGKEDNMVNVSSLLLEKLANDIGGDQDDRRKRGGLGFPAAWCAVIFSYVMLGVVYYQVFAPCSWFNIVGADNDSGKFAQFALISGSFLNFIAIHVAVIKAMFQTSSKENELSVKDILEIIKNQKTSGGE